MVSYDRALREFTSRQLSYVTDILITFEGIMASFHHLFRSRFLYGLPQTELDSQLLWQPLGDLSRRFHHSTAIPLFPSWSWAGWIGRIRCDVKENLSRITWMDEEGECFSSEDYRYPKTKNEMKRLLWRVQWRITVSTKRIQMSGFSTRQLQKLGESPDQTSRVVQSIYSSGHRLRTKTSLLRETTIMLSLTSTED